MSLLKSLLKYYNVELGLIFVSFILFIIGYTLLGATIPVGDFVNMFVRKTFLFGSGLTLAYIVRRIKIGQIDWKEEDKKWYAMAIIIYAAIIFGCG